jgi:hypothetical protein
MSKMKRKGTTMIECHRCGSLLNHWGEPHECFTPPTPPQSRLSVNGITGTNLGYWEAHDRRIRELSSRFPELSFSETVDLACLPPDVAEARLAELVGTVAKAA